MSFFSLVSKSLQIPLALNQEISESNQNQGLPTNKDEQYILEVLIIDQKTICVVSEHRLKFYSVVNCKTGQQNIDSYCLHQNQLLIGEICFESDLSQLFYQYTKPFRTNFTQQDDSKFSFAQPTLVQYKGIIYDKAASTFYLLLNSSADPRFSQSKPNKYLISFQIQLNHDYCTKTIHFNENTKCNQKSQDPKSEDSHSHPQFQSNSKAITISNFTILYNFALPHQQIKYSLQISPQLIYLQKSSTLILIRKFYNDSFVIIFKSQPIQQDSLTLAQLDRKESSDSENQRMIPSVKKESSYLSSQPKQVYWSFYINEECLSALDSSNFLVNYRQLITKHYAEIDVIDIGAHSKMTFRLDQNIEPMTIKNIQSLSIEEGNEFKIRIFAISSLRKQNKSIILDYDLIHQSLYKTYTIPNFYIESITFPNPSKDYYICNYIYEQKNRVGLFPVNMTGLQNEIHNKTIVNQIVSSSVQHHLDCLVCSLDYKAIISYRISPKNRTLYLEISSIIDKNFHYSHILSKIKDKMEIFKNQDFQAKVFKFLSSQP